MPDTTIVGSDLPTGWTDYAVIRAADANGNPATAWNGTAYVAYDVGDWADYATAAPETPAASGTYVCQFPLSSPAGYYTWTLYRQVGGSPSSTDDPNVSFPAPATYWNGSEFATTQPSNPSPVDLITSAYAVQVLAAGGVTLTGAQSTILPTMITAVSREIIRYCSRQFALTTYAEIVSPEGGRQDRGEPASAKLSAFPVQSIASVLTCRSAVLAIRNTGTATNQFASVAFTLTGDVEYLDLAYTGLTLSRMASGVTTATTLSFANNVTLGALATAINALGSGWNATVQSGYEKHPSASLVGVREPKNALSSGACLEMFVEAASGYSIDRDSGIMRCNGGGWAGSSLGGFGGYGTDWDEMGGGYGGVTGWGQYQVSYQAGWATIPQDLQQIAAEAVKGMYARLDGDPSLKSETADRYSWAAKDSVANLSSDAMVALNRYRSWSV